MAVMPLFLCQKGNPLESARADQEPLGRHYGLPMVRAGDSLQAAVDSGSAAWDHFFSGPESVHPNDSGHARIAAAVIEKLEAAWNSLPAGGQPIPPAPPVPTPLHSDDYEHVRAFGAAGLQPYRCDRWIPGSDVHPEYALRGGGEPGWSSCADGAEIEFRVSGKIVGVWYSESERYRNAEAWIDDRMAEAVVLECYGPERRGYLGWAYKLVADGLSPGPHALHVRMKDDSFRGSGRTANLVSVMTAGLSSIRIDSPQSRAMRLVGPRDPALSILGRVDWGIPESPVFIWQGTEARLRLSGGRIGARFANAWGPNCYNLIVDGQERSFRLAEGGAHDYLLDGFLPEGSHEVSLWKRSEAYSSHAAFLGFLADPDARLGPLLPERPLRMEFFGDSITAGACNEDPGEDQYLDPYTHDAYLSYGAIAARELGADYVGTAVSGVGLCYSWNPRLMPGIWDRLYPEADSRPYAFSGRKPDVAVIALGQNDHGYPLSVGKPFPDDFAQRYIGLGRSIRSVYPEAYIVCAIGGMTAYRESPELRDAFGQAVSELKRGDGRVLSIVFKAASRAHPRVAVHRKLADELESFLRKNLPTALLEKPRA
jgi:hypothetical protein